MSKTILYFTDLEGTILEENSGNYDDEQMKLKQLATSLKNEYKKEFDREEIINKILENIEKEIDI